jgi:hypothetical protein
MNWIDLAEERDKLLAVENLVMNFEFHKMWGTS